VRKATIQYIQVGTERARYEVVGEGEPVVLVHGLSGSTLWWRRNVPALAQNYRVYSVDLPGFGSMRSWHTRFVLKQAASWLLQWMDEVGLQRVHLIGHSMGGYICLWLAAHYPERVSQLVLAAPALISRINKVQGYFLPLLTGARYMSPSFFGILLYDALRAGPLTLLRAARDLIAQDVRDDMKQVNVPTLLIWGDHDTLVPVVVAPIVHEEIPGSRLYILKGAGHVCMFDRAKEFNTAVQAFLSGEVVGSL
jgi:pimeloyl-ACP methyl ester carboxylesterase